MSDSPKTFGDIAPKLIGKSFVRALTDERALLHDEVRAAVDAMMYGTGVLRDGKHVPLERFQLSPEAQETLDLMDGPLPPAPCQNGRTDG